MSEGTTGARLATNLARNLIRIREQRNLTQQQLSKLCGVPRSTIANIETGSSNPTLGVLGKLAVALQSPLEQLLSAPQARCEVFRAGALPVLKRGRKKKTLIHKLLPHPIPGMEIDRMALAPGDRHPGVPHRAGTQEYLAVESGTLTLYVGGDRFDLERGDVATFPGDQAHSYANRGDQTAIGFSVVVLAPVQSWTA